MKLRSATQLGRSLWRQSFRVALLFAIPRRLLLAAVPGRDAVCLTFDDGPDPKATPRVLDILATTHVRATFFVQGAHAAAHPALIARIRNEGHEIGHHSWTHGSPAETTAAALAAEVKRTRAFLRREMGVEVSLFRPPHGKVTALKLFRLWAEKQTVVLWSNDPGDVFQASSTTFLDWFERNPPRPGDIILLHDRAAALSDGLEKLIGLVKAKGLGFSTVGETLGPAWERTPVPADGLLP